LVEHRFSLAGTTLVFVNIMLHISTNDSSFRGAPLGASPESITSVLAMAYYVYLLASKKHGTLYLGVTKDLVWRVYEHRTKAVDGFTSRYGSTNWSGLKSTMTPQLRLLAKKNSRNGGATGRFG
jgi:hypothetical protein